VVLLQLEPVLRETALWRLEKEIEEKPEVVVWWPEPD
jgi:hypothetical protein